MGRVYRKLGGGDWVGSLVLSFDASEVVEMFVSRQSSSSATLVAIFTRLVGYLGSLQLRLSYVYFLLCKTRCLSCLSFLLAW